MLVPRGFGTQAPRKSTLPRGHDEKLEVRAATKPNVKQTDGWRGFGWRPESFNTVQAQQRSTIPIKSARTRLQAAQASQQGDVEKSLERPNAQRSTPMAVPSRPSTNRTLSQPPDQETRRSPNGSRPPSTRPKKEARLPASVASMLESTSIPKKTSFVQPRSSPTQAPSRMSGQQLMEEWRKDGGQLGSSLSGSPNLDLLLSAPEESTRLERNESMESFDVLSRSGSSDSVPAIPFLEPDEKSELSWSMPATPSPQAQRKAKEKLHAQRQKLYQDLEHPLSPPNMDDMDDDYQYRVSKAETSSLSSTEPARPIKFRPTSQTRRPSSFKSNLTASIHTLRNSIRTSLSNFSGPSPYVLPDDHLSRGFFGSSGMPIRSEMRPRPFQGPPTPELRRYMNPSSYHVRSPGHEFHLHGRGRGIEHVELEAAAAALSPGAADELMPTLMDRDSIIPLQTYDRSWGSQPKVPSSPHASARAGDKQGTLTEAGRALAVDDEPDQPRYRRELRENGEFLRVCILEMNMRRAGKLSDGPGRARLWLAPRDVSKKRQDGSDDVLDGKKIPRRWVAIAAPS